MTKVTIDDLLGQYWDLAYKEGKTGVSHGTKASKVLCALRAALQAAPAQQGLDELVIQPFGNDGKTEHYVHVFGTEKMLKRLIAIHEQFKKQAQPVNQALVNLIGDMRSYVFEASERYYDGTKGSRIRASAEALLTRTDAALAQSQPAQGLTDGERLDFLQASGVKNQGWIARQSSTGRGYRLHQDYTGFVNVRDAIDAAIQKSQK